MMHVYMASKMPHSEEIIKIYLDNPDIHFTSRWPYLEKHVEPTPENAVNFWKSDFQDVDNADYLILHLKEDDIPRGALVEVGYAIKKGCNILIYGENPYHGTWQYHASVKKFDTLEDCLDHIRYETKTIEKGSRS